eukprot:GHVS01074482.1.p1 GENE.GHVS01074482.1~~GHVS01074482.1.p1  ORF type:complete len:587 (-),score=106.61 GHVS01074482.1:199-1959(-)
MGTTSSSTRGPFGVKASGFVPVGIDREFYKGPLSPCKLPDGPNGVLFGRCGDVYVGGFRRGLKHGHGVLVDVHGTMYRGRWEEDIREGPMDVWFADGSSQVTTWKAGCLICQQDQTPPAEPPYSDSETTTDKTEDVEIPRSVFDEGFTGDASKSYLWSCAQVCHWLASHDCAPEWIDACRRCNITGRRLMKLNHEQLRDELNMMQFGQRAEFLSLIQNRKNFISSTSTSSTASSSSLLLLPPPPPAHTSFSIPFEALHFLERLGGSSSRTWRARWLGKDVAVKVFSGRLRSPRRWAECLRRLRELRHPSIALLLGVAAKEPQHHGLVMEYYANGSVFGWLHGMKDTTEHVEGPQTGGGMLDTAEKRQHGEVSECNKGRQQDGGTDVFRRGPMNVQLVLKLARGISLGCAYLRQRQLDHLDLKSSNVLLDESLNVKLTDFGLASVEECFDPIKNRPMVEQLPNTPLPDNLRSYNWTAPEALRQRTSFGLDTRSDVYSFGVVLWEMLTCLLPFDGFTNAQILGAVGFGGHRPRQLEAPEHMKEVVDMCVCGEPAARATFEDVIDHLGTLYEMANSSAEDALITFMDGS